MESSQYSAILNNEAVLTNAAQFTTAQRAFVAKLIPRTDILDKFSQQELDFLALQAFSEFLTATEDLLGWVAVLRKWDPADDFSLFEQLDKVRVGPDLESDVLEYLTKLDPDGLRGLLQVPSDEQMLYQIDVMLSYMGKIGVGVDGSHGRKKNPDSMGSRGHARGSAGTVPTRRGRRSAVPAACSVAAAYGLGHGRGSWGSGSPLPHGTTVGGLVPTGWDC
jgi:hypothetical protein